MLAKAPGWASVLFERLPSLTGIVVGSIFLSLSLHISDRPVAPARNAGEDFILTGARSPFTDYSTAAFRES